MDCRLPIADCQFEDSKALCANVSCWPKQASARLNWQLAIGNWQSRRNRQSAIGNRQSQAFTLVEVLVSIAIALLLVLGISQVFSIAQRTTGTGNAILQNTEYVRSIQGQLAGDFLQMTNAPNDSPGLVITSYSEAAFRSKTDKTEDRDGDPLTINDPTGPLSLINNKFTAAVVNSRVHRVDKICFFARGQFNRQTGDAPNLTSPTSSSEAFIWLGHLALPSSGSVALWDPSTLGTKAGQAFGPGYPQANGVTNDNNLYATQWILGREVILLSQNLPAYAQGGEVAFPPPQANPPSDPLSLLTAAAQDPGSGQLVPLWLSRFDLVATSINQYRQFIVAYPNTNGHWWYEHLSGTAFNPSHTSINDERYLGNPFLRKPPAGASPKVASQWMSAAAAQSHPIFVPGCTHFIVEYAGNFTTQDNDPTPGVHRNPGARNTQYGDVLAGVPDPTNKLDFQVERDRLGNIIGSHIRWYGFPRDTNGDGRVTVQDDVVPLRDVLATVSYPPSLCERSGPVYAKGGDPTTARFTNLNGYPVSDFYVCAWGPDTDAAGIPRPKMVRITIGIDDPTGRLNNEQFFEFVYNLP